MIDQNPTDQIDFELDTQNLYREESYTDLKAGAIRRLMPVQADRPEDPWLKAWLEFHPNVPPPGPFVSNLVFVDESRDRAYELARTYSANTFRSF